MSHKNAVKIIEKSYFDSETSLGDMFAGMTLAEFSSETTVEDLVQAWADAYRTIEYDVINRVNTDEETSIDVATGKTIIAEDMTVQGAINDLMKYTEKTRPLLVSVWTEYDVQGIADEYDTKLSDNEIKQVFKDIDRNHDSEIGITWESIRFAVEEVVKSRKEN